VERRTFIQDVTEPLTGRIDQRKIAAKFNNLEHAVDDLTTAVEAISDGDERKTGYCNDIGHAPLQSLHPDLGEGVYASGTAMNDPRINEAPNTVAPTGSFPHCRNAFGVFDMVGNLHEWTADASGTFRGGYYLDTKVNGKGCGYATTAHAPGYHDYSTGFRCCRDAQ